MNDHFHSVTKLPLLFTSENLTLYTSKYNVSFLQCNSLAIISNAISNIKRKEKINK